MYITKEKFKEIKAKHNSLLIMEDDVDEALAFVQELLEAEADALKVSEPHAVVSIRKLEAARSTPMNLEGSKKLFFPVSKSGFPPVIRIVESYTIFLRRFEQ